jgi:hypothetical protein
VKRTLGVWVLVAIVLAAGPGTAAGDAKPATKVTADLADLYQAHAAAVATGVPFMAGRSLLPVSGDWVIIDASASGDAGSLQADLRALGAQGVVAFGRVVSARLPIPAIPALDGVASLRFARPAYRTTRAGLVTSQGDRAMRADIARTTFGVNGAGVTVGVLSDSFDCQGGAAGDVANGDLSPVNLLQDDPGCASGTDEGRAMLQIVHDVAPGASLAFATAEGGQANFANNILNLKAAGAKVIVDDVGYFAEPMFQDGIIAQAVDTVVAQGVTYFSAAGNSARQAYDHAFVAGTSYAAGALGNPLFLGGTAHNFNPGGTEDNFQKFTIPANRSFVLSLQWDSPFFSVSGTGTPTDLDIYVLNDPPTTVLFGVTTNNITSGDPVEVMFVNCSSATPCTGNLMIVKHSGPNPGRFKYIVQQAPTINILEYGTNSGTIYGHPNAAGAIAVGAAFYQQTPAFGVIPAVLESFSSSGTTPILFTPGGAPTSDARASKPEVVAPDGANTTFFFAGVNPDGDAFPNFFGTSAAAPHAAGVAALMLDAIPGLTPAQIRSTLENTALDMGAPGFDTDSGFGLIQADAALASLHTLMITSGPSGTPNPVDSEGPVSLSVTAADDFGHTLGYTWVAMCLGLASNGSFDNAALQTPTWTAPVNVTGSSKSCTMQVTVSDGVGLSQMATYVQAVMARGVSLVTGAGFGGGPHVRSFDGATGDPIPGGSGSFFAFAPTFTGGVRVAAIDVNGDARADIVTGAGPGGSPLVRVFDGATGAQLAGPMGNFLAFDAQFMGGVFVAAGRCDGHARIIVGADAGGGPHVKVFDQTTGSLLFSFFAYAPGFTGGVRVAAGDVDGDGCDDIVTAAGPGGGPHIQVFSGRTLAVLRSFFAYGPAFSGGVYVAAGDVNGDGMADVITGAGPGGGPHVQAFSGKDGSVLRSFFAYAPGFTGGVRVAAADVNGDGKADIVTAAGPGGGPHVKIFDGTTLAVSASFFAYDPLFTGGVFVGAR